MSAPNAPEELTQGQERALDRVMDKVEDRLWGASEGAHRVHPGASWEEVHAVGLKPEYGYFWTRFNGMELAQGEVEVARLDQIEAWTEEFQERLRPGDRVIGQRGRDVYVLPEDPWAEGAVVLLVDEVKQRGPLASSVGHWVLALLGEFALLFDEDGEYRDELFDESTGQLVPDTQRKILRRRLDMDPDGPMARFELGQLLRAQGETRAAISELKRAIKVAPEFSWSHYELGRCYFGEKQLRPALGCFESAAEHTGDNLYLYALFSAWAIRCVEKEDDPKIASLRKEILARVPNFAKDQLEEACELLEEDSAELIEEHLALGLAVAPKDLGLLAMRHRFDQAQEDDA